MGFGGKKKIWERGAEIGIFGWDLCAVHCKNFDIRNSKKFKYLRSCGFGSCSAEQITESAPVSEESSGRSFGGGRFLGGDIIFFFFRIVIASAPAGLEPVGSIPEESQSGGGSGCGFFLFFLILFGSEKKTQSIK